MLKTKTAISTVACVATSALLSAGSFAADPEIVFDNSSGRTGQYVEGVGNWEIGDDVSFAPGFNRTITDFELEYFLSEGASGVTATVKVYALDGGPSPAGPIPETLLYQSIPFTLEPGTKTIEPTAFTPFDVPDSIVWTLSLSGLDGSEEFGLLYAGTPEVGSSADVLYRFAGGSWTILTTPDGPGGPIYDSVIARFTAVPEPSTWALLVGGLGMLGFWNYRRKA